MKDIEKYIKETISNINLINPDEIPNIDLYMDQVTTFLTSRLAGNIDTDIEPVFTKTMINNYAKCQLLPSPEKKKYTKDHMLMLINIYFLKNVMSINNIHKLMKPVTDTNFQVERDFNLESVYNEIFRSVETLKEDTKNDMLQKLNFSKSSFENAPADEKDYLQLYSYINLLAFDIYMKKQLIESLIDTIIEPTDDDDSNDKSPNKEKKEKKEKK